ncbi:hypothetical protein GNF80_03770 [Clostridium perfringens]|nr:hypothetical protein [Clostridium perfringens]
MKKFSSFILLIFILLISTLFLGCDSSPKDELIKLPNKIFVYYDGSPIEISKDNKIFKEIVELTNKRIDKDKISTAQDVVSENYVDSLKKEKLSLEFLYEEEQEMNLTGDGFMPMKYTKLFFPLVINEDSSYDQSSTIATFQYGTAQGYTDSSRSPLNESKELIELLMNNVVLLK